MIKKREKGSCNNRQFWPTGEKGKKEMFFVIYKNIRQYWKKSKYIELALTRFFVIETMLTSETTSIKNNSLVYFLLHILVIKVQSNIKFTAITAYTILPFLSSYEDFFSSANLSAVSGCSSTKCLWGFPQLPDNRVSYGSYHAVKQCQTQTDKSLIISSEMCFI